MADSIQDIIDQAARQYGVDPVALKAVAFLESRFDPSAKNPRSSAGGLFQQIDSNAKAYGVKNRMDPKQSALGAARFMADNTRTLRKVLGRDPNAGELYLAHQQGPGGASKILRNPNAKAVDVVGADAVRLNGGNMGMSAREFGGIWTNKAERAASRVSNGEYTAQLSLPASGDISGGGGSDTVAGGEGDDGVVTRDRAAIEATYRAFLDDEMSPQDRADYEDDVRSGRMPIPQGMSVGKPINASPAQISDVYESYTSGNMPDDQRADYEADVRAGVMGLPDTASVQFGQITPVQQAAPEERGFFEETGRQLGLTARAAGQGVAGMVGVVQDPINVLISKALGVEALPPLREQAGAAMTELGVPVPETAIERVVGMGAEAMVGAGAGIAGALGAAKSAAPGVSQVVANSMAAAPAAQVAGAAGGGLAQQGAAEAGAGPVAQTVAALTGGLVGSGVGSALTRADIPGAAPQATQIDADPPREIDVLMAKSKKRLADRSREVDRLSADDNPVRLSGNGRTALVSASPDRPSKWRLTIIGDDGVPNGHIDADTKPAAIRRALEDGYAAKQGVLAAADSVDAPRAGITQDAPPLSGPAMDRSEIGEIAFRAGRGDVAAQKRLAKLARVDPAAMAAAERLGIDMPADVFGMNTQIDEIAGMLRTQKGEAASRDWEESLSVAAARAQEVMRGETQFASISDASDEIRRSLKGSIDTLDDAASELFAKTGGILGSTDKARAPNLLELMERRAAGLDGVENLNPTERQLLEMVSKKDGVTYNLLDRKRREIGLSAFQNKGDYTSVPEMELKEMYHALRDDMMNYSDVIGGPDARANLEKAFALKSQSHDLRKKITDGFGRSENGSIASLMRQSIKSAGRGDKRKLFDALKVIPEDLRKDTLIAAIDDIATAGGGSANRGAFSFANFNSAWTDLKKQTPIMAMIRQELGPETFETMSDLASASKNIQRALNQTQAAKKTGASLTAEVFVDGLMARMMNAPAGRTMANMGAGIGVASSIGGPLGVVAAAGTQAGLSSLKLGGKKPAAAAAFLNSPAFKQMASSAWAEGVPSPSSVSRASKSPAFLRWAKSSGISDPRAWLVGALTPQQSVTIQNNQEQPDGR